MNVILDVEKMKRIEKKPINKTETQKHCVSTNFY